MNSSDSNNNLLFFSNDEENINHFYKTILKFIKHEKIVLILSDAENLIKLLPLLKEKLSGLELKRFVAIKVDTIEECIDRLFEQHDWAWLPALIIIDLHLIITKLETQISAQKNVQDLNSTEADVKPIIFFQQLALCIADLFEYRRSVLSRVKKLAETKGNINTIDNIFSILILSENPNHLTREQIDLIINLYYYKNNAFDDVIELLNKISIDC